MISLYILLIANGVAIFGLIVTVFSHIKKVDRSKRMGHFFLVFGVIVAVIAGFSINKENEAHQAAIFHQKKLQAEQIYDAGLVHISDKQVRIKHGQAKVTFYVSANTKIKIHSNHEQLHDLDYKPIKEKKNIRVTFVMPGGYTVTATRGQNKIVKHITVIKANPKKVTSASSLSSSEVISQTSDDMTVSETVESDVGDASSETVVEPDITESDTMAPTVTEVSPSTDYQPVWSPSTDTTTTDTTTTDTTTTDTEDSTSTDTQTSADSATTETTSIPDYASNNIEE